MPCDDAAMGEDDAAMDACPIRCTQDLSGRGRVIIQALIMAQNQQCLSFYPQDQSPAVGDVLKCMILHCGRACDLHL
jgi:hypothetical protein